MNKMKKSVVLLLITLLAVFQVGVAFAQGDPPTTRAIAPMTLDCASLTGSALEYAEEHNLCPSGGDISPNGIRVGDCGSSWLYIGALGGGYATFDIGAESFLGPIANANYNVSWSNSSKSRNGYLSGSDWLLSTRWSTTRVDYTDTGFVTAVMTGVVTLAWGGTCVFLDPTDGRYIS